MVGSVNCSAMVTFCPGASVAVAFMYGLPAGGNKALVVPVGVKSVASLLKLSSTSENGPTIVIVELFVRITLWANRPVPIFSTKPPRVTPIEPLTSVAHMQAEKFAVTVCPLFMTTVVEALDGSVTFPVQARKPNPGFGVAFRGTTESSGSSTVPALGVVLPPVVGELAIVNGSACSMPARMTH